MFAKKKENKRENKRPRNPGSLAQYGIFEVPESLGDLSTSFNDDDDEDLEAELAALTSSNGSGAKPRRKAPPKPVANLDALISESLKDIPSDEDVSGDDDDPDLLDELKEITGNSPSPEPLESNESPVKQSISSNINETINILKERMSMYKLAEEKAKKLNDSSRARRFGRGIKTLEEMIKSCKSGSPINIEDIPPILPKSAISDETPATAVPVVKEPAKNEEPATPIPAEESVSVTEDSDANLVKEPINVDEEKLNTLINRQKEYKMAALAWKKNGNLEQAVNLIKIAKQFDIVINSVNQGETVDLSDMPPSPQLPSATNATDKDSFTPDAKEENETQQSTVSVNPASSVKSEQSLEVALKERLEIYRRSKAVAETEGNSSKARRYARICKQFEDAIKLHSKGKPVPLDELPTPPGYPPLQSSSPSAVPKADQLNDSEHLQKPDAPADDSVSSANILPQTKPESDLSPKENKPPVVPPRQNSEKKKLTSRADKQVQLLQHRQKELKMAALKAKKDGDLDLAKDYLRQAKGIDPLISASLSGLPVDMKSVPLSPEAKRELDEQNDSVSDKSVTSDGFMVISSLDCIEDSGGTDQEIYENLESQLTKQIQWCLTTRDHCKALGDVANYNKWGRLALDYKKDLDMLRVRKRDGRPPPQHHYEVKTYTIVQCCTDLMDADLEISILRGLNYPKETDTYVIFEFPYPTDTPTTNRTSTIRDSCNPEYNANFSLSGLIDRKSRQCLRIFKRQALKCQVWSKGCSWNPVLCCTHPRGFFRSDSLLGTATVKLQPLETKCIIHDSFPLMDGRKATGGKLEVKIRLRNPMITKQIEQNTDKWLAIDYK